MLTSFPESNTLDQEASVSTERGKALMGEIADARKAYAQLEPVVDAVFLTRDLVSEPPNVLYPVEFARRAKELTKLGVKVEVLGEAEAARALGHTDSAAVNRLKRVLKAYALPIRVPDECASGPGLAAALGQPLGAAAVPG